MNHSPSKEHHPPLEKQPSLSDAIANADARLVLLDKKIAKLGQELIKCNDQMKKLQDGPLRESIRQKALKILKYKRSFETDRDHLMQQSFIMEKTNLTLQAAQNAQMAKNALKQIENENKKIKHNLRSDSEMSIRDEAKEIFDESNEIQEALSRSYGTPDIDEAELEAELAALNDEMSRDADDSYLDQASAAPDVPSHHPVNQQTPSKKLRSPRVTSV